MTAPDPDSVWRRLQVAGLVTGAMPSAEANAGPWVVRVMQAVAAWIAALLLIASAVLTALVDSAPSAVAAGLAACGSAAVLLRRASEASFGLQLGLAVSLAGQGLLLVTLSDTLDIGVMPAAIVMAALQAVLFYLIPSFVHRVWSAGCFAVAWAVALGDAGLHAYATGLMAAAAAWLWLHEFEPVTHGDVGRACGYGLVLALVGTTAWIVAEAASTGPTSDGWQGHAVIGAGLNGAVLLSAVYALLLREAVEPGSPGGLWVLVSTGIVAVATLKAPGLAPAVLVLLLGHANGNVALAGLGGASLLGYLAFYYYSLETTLLYKSVVMAVTGAGLLGVRLVLRRVLRDRVREGGNA